MTRNRDDIEDPAPQIIGSDLSGPVPKTKKRQNSTCLRLDNSSVWENFQLPIARNVVTMCMSVSYGQRNTLAIVSPQPLINLIGYDPRNVGFTCARIKQKCLLFSKYQVQKRPFVVCTARLAKN